MAGKVKGVFADPSRPTGVADAGTARIGEALPYLRRYARALTGSQESGDAFVRATLEAALSSSELHARVSRGRVQLYEAFSEIWNSANVEPMPLSGNGSFPADEAKEQRIQRRLAEVSPIQRQALLLTQLEEFSLAETGEILGLSPGETAFLVDQAVAEIEQDEPTNVLVIEDEPLISSHIEAIVEEMGHRVVAVAATAKQAIAAYAAHKPGLVLADIQLADGSSGLTAVDDILALGPIPTIFITAFPEKLLTGKRPEPSFLVAKPFREETLRATISQALFFGPTFGE
jgi:CheY-like chemotaxis protein